MVDSSYIAPQDAFEGNFIFVSDTKAALRRIAAHHRQRFSIPVVAITGSRGKTVVKEWLFSLLNPDMNVTRSPRSYNSQIGVPLSLWQLDEKQPDGAD